MRAPSAGAVVGWGRAQKRDKWVWGGEGAGCGRLDGDAVGGGLPRMNGGEGGCHGERGRVLGRMGEKEQGPTEGGCGVVWDAAAGVGAVAAMTFIYT